MRTSGILTIGGAFIAIIGGAFALLMLKVFLGSGSRGFADLTGLLFGAIICAIGIAVMFFGKKFINKGRSEGELGIDSANTAYAQIQKIDPAIRIGLCPCLGQNGSKEEVFTLEDAKTLKAFADRTAWVCSLHYWSINDDAVRSRKRSASRPAAATQRQAWAFANVFKSFTAP